MRNVLGGVRIVEGSAYVAIPLGRMTLAQFGALPRLPPKRAPLLGEHTDEILLEVLGLSDAEVGKIHDEKVVAGPEPL
jgi:hypothetical protein